MGDMGDGFRAMREDERLRRADARRDAPATLRALGYVVSEHSGGAHIVIQHGGVTIDYWPGPGRWHRRDARSVRGFTRDSLLALLASFGPTK